MKSTPITCIHCKQTVDKPKKEIDRQVRQGRNTFFCSLSCSAKYNNENNYEILKKNCSHLIKLNIGNTYNKKGEFTYYLKKAKERSKRKNQDMNIDEEHLNEIWTGRCAITNVPIELRTYKNTKSINIASLDRIDSKKGYIKGNVQFVSLPVNYAKNSFENDEIKTWFENLCKI